MPGLLAAVRRRGATLATVVVTGTALLVGSLALAGWSRLVSPLTYQSHRGLQIESVAATPAMVARLAHPHRWRVFFSVHHAYEIVGPGTRWLTEGSTLATGVFVLLLLVAWGLAFRRSGVLPASPEAFVWVSLAAITGFVVTGMVFSPQYLLWILPAAAAGLVVVERRHRLMSWTVVGLVACGLTQLIFPLEYHHLLRVHAGSGVAVGLLVLRNLLVALLAVAAWWETGRALVSRRGPARRGLPPARPRAAATAR